MILQIPVIVEDDGEEDSTGMSTEVQAVIRSEDVAAVVEACKNIPVVDEHVCEVLMKNGTVFIVNMPYKRMRTAWINAVVHTEGSTAGCVMVVAAGDLPGFGDLA